jgi:serine/threonine protein phosphatase PrpC
MAHLAASNPKPSADAGGAPICFAMHTHRGRVRQSNQDSCDARAEIAAFVVCDGVGGAAGGEIASRLATESFLDAVASLRSEHSRSDPAAATTPSLLHQAICAANQTVLERAQRDPTLRGMGTTLVAALADPADRRRLWVAHVGDSRCYRLRQGTFDLLTRDHSLVEEHVRAGMLTRRDAESSPIRNIITRAVGSEPVVEPDIAAHVSLPGDIFLLASDGLTRELPDAAIAQVLGRSLASGISASALEAACHALVDQANASGGRDNITVLVLACR